MTDPVGELLEAVAARHPVDDRERASIERILATVPQLERPFDQHADPVHVTASALIVGRRGIVLLRHRRLGIWVQPGGHIDAGEEPWTAAVREATEETGLRVRLAPGLGDRPAPTHLDVHPGGRGHTHLDVRYLLVAGDDDPAPPPEESQDVAWFGWDEAMAIADAGLVGVLPSLAVRFGPRQEGPTVDVIELHRRAVEVFLERIEDIDEDQWGLPTPCADWDVRALVNHVVVEDLWTPPLLAGRTIADVGDELDGDQLGPDDPVLVAGTAATNACIAVSRRVPTGGTVHLSYGDDDVVEYVRQLTADHLIHAWDVAVAIDGDRSLDPVLVEGIGAWFVDREEVYRLGGLIGPRVEVATDDPAARLLGAFGRDPG